jgi:ubiquinol-cytochrome c reductase iron-sulfur subunit
VSGDRDQPGLPTGSSGGELATTAATVDIHASPDNGLTEAEERYYERWVTFWFLLSLAAAAGFIAVIWAFPISSYLFTPLLGISMAVALGGIGIGAILWAKTLMADEEAVQEREPLAPSPEERAATGRVFNEGVARTGIMRYKMLRRSLVLSAVASPVLLTLGALRDIGPRPRSGELIYDGWSANARLVNFQNVPIKLGDLEIGGATTVFPENKVDVALAAAMLIRLGPGVNHPAPGRADWAPEGHVAYSKICTHLGCPVGLYEQQIHLLLCPCHQSQFAVPDHCKVLFGPAARPLPQLDIYIDSDGFFHARSNFAEPVGPGFWERK